MLKIRRLSMAFWFAERDLRIFEVPGRYRNPPVDFCTGYQLRSHEKKHLEISAAQIACPLSAAGRKHGIRIGIAIHLLVSVRQSLRAADRTRARLPAFQRITLSAGA